MDSTAATNHITFSLKRAADSTAAQSSVHECDVGSTAATNHILLSVVSSDLQMNGRALDSTAARSSEQQYTVDATAASNNIPSLFVKRFVFACA